MSYNLSIGNSIHDENDEVRYPVDFRCNLEKEQILISLDDREFLANALILLFEEFKNRAESNS
jgi:hypothetical protein